MTPNSHDPAVAARLIDFIDALKSGSNVEDAARRVGLDKKTALDLLESVRRELAVKSLAPTDGGGPVKTGRGLSLIAVCDGASRGNPGDAACAVILSDAKGDEVLRRARRLGKTTNNVAEYHGVIFALELAQTLGASVLLVKLDSELVVKQLNGQYKVKHPSLKPLFEKARALASSFKRFDVIHVPRTETAKADQLANDELDGKVQ